MKPKKSLNKINNDNLTSLIEQYFISEIYLIENDSIILIIKLNKINELMKNDAKLFNNLTSSLSMYLDEYLQDDFKRWNVYIIYIVEEAIAKEIKYKIENDTFFARKILEDSYSSQLSDKNIQKLISKYIDFTDLTFNSMQPKKEVYKSTSEIYLKLRDVNIISEAQIDEMLKSLEKDKK